MPIEDYLPYLVVAAAALAALVVITMIFRAFAGRVRGRRGSRLGISEYYEIDKQRRLVLVRRDGIEHLLLIGGGQDIVIETNVGVTTARPDEAPATPWIRPADRLLAEEDRLPAEAVRREPVVVRPVPLRPQPRPAAFGEGAMESEAQPRVEPRLQPVRADDGDREA